MKKGWVETTLGEIGKVSMCKRIFKEETTANGGIPFYKIGTFGKEPDAFIPVQTYNEYRSKYPFPTKGDVLISASGTIGRRVRYDGEPAYFQDSNIVWIENDEIHVLNDYLYHFYGACAWNSTKGATISRLYNDDLRRIAIAFPKSHQEQQRIVGLLDEAFEGIATAKANAEKNLQNSHAIFESHLQSVFTQRGMGWVEKTIGETCTLKSGTTISPILEKPIGDIPYLKVADMTFDGNEDLITTSSRFLLDADVRESAIIPKGATIFPKRGGAILTNKKRITSLPVCADLNIMAVIPSSQIDARLLYFYFLNVDMRKLGTGSSIPQINNYDVAPLQISFPKSLAIQEQIVSKFDSLREETQSLSRVYEQKLAALEALKKSMLHQAFTGNL